MRIQYLHLSVLVTIAKGRSSAAHSLRESEISRIYARSERFCLLRSQAK
jgi:hypothetical protein